MQSFHRRVTQLRRIWWLITLVLFCPLVIKVYGLNQVSGTQVSSRLSVQIFDTGGGQVSYLFDDWGGISFSLNSTSNDHEESGDIPFSIHPEGSGVFEIGAGVTEGGPEELNPYGRILRMRLCLHLWVLWSLVRHGQGHL